MASQRARVIVAAVCNRHAIFLLGVADAIRRHVAARFSFASAVTDRRYKTLHLLITNN
jgi:hypothetical protein